jgi:hypothetical protein
MPMIRDVSSRRFRHPLLLAVLALAAGSAPALAQKPAATQVAAKLVCGSHSANPKELKPFETQLEFHVSGYLWTSERKTSPEPGNERFLGILSPSGTMLIVGEGKLDDGASWTYEFSGRKAPNGITIVRGSLVSDKPKGRRLCSLAF